MGGPGEADTGFGRAVLQRIALFYADDGLLGSTDEEWAKAKNSIAANMIMGGLGIKLPTGDAILTLNYTSNDRAFAAEVANAYVKALSLSDTKEDIAQNEILRQNLEQQIAE